jgi:hypothetical protein
MKYSIVAVVAALATSVQGLASFTNSNFNIVAGQAFTLTWKEEGGSGPYTVNVKNGPSTNLKTYQSLGSKLTLIFFPLITRATDNRANYHPATSSLTLSFTPSASMPSGTYAFEIIDSTGVPNYSVQWAFVGSASASSGSATTTTAATTTSSTTATTTSSATTTTSKSVTSSSSGSVTSSASSSSSSGSTSK